MSRLYPGVWPDCQYVSHQYGVSNKNSAPYIEITFSVPVGDKGPDGVIPSEQIAYIGYCTTDPGDKTIGNRMMLVRVLRACGWKGTDILRLDGIGSELVDLTLEEKASDDGTKSYLNVKYVNRAGERPSVGRPMGPDDMRQFASEMAHILAMESGAGTPLAQQAAAPPPPPPQRPQPQRPPVHAPPIQHDRRPHEQRPHAGQSEQHPGG